MNFNFWLAHQIVSRIFSFSVGVFRRLFLAVLIRIKCFLVIFLIIWFSEKFVSRTSKIWGFVETRLVFFWGCEFFWPNFSWGIVENSNDCLSAYQIQILNVEIIKRCTLIFFLGNGEKCSWFATIPIAFRFLSVQFLGRIRTHHGSSYRIRPKRFWWYPKAGSNFWCIYVYL